MSCHGCRSIRYERGMASRVGVCSITSMIVEHEGPLGVSEAPRCSHYATGAWGRRGAVA